jgi:EAL domain-containing protein (putative c-di-GMP-specific phosphodiesterase class I)
MPHTACLETNPAPAYLDHYPEAGIVQRVWLNVFPFDIGRNKTAGFIVYSSQVSKEHARIDRQGEGFCIRDLGSTNGTFVNGMRVKEAALANGDIIHVAHKEFRFGCGLADAPADSEVLDTKSAESRLPPSFIRGNLLLRELLDQRQVSVDFQPIVSLATGQPMGYEALGRGAHDQLSPHPYDLFHLAEQCKLAPELSQLFRMLAVQEAQFLPPDAQVFFNLHPTEMNETFVQSLERVRDGLRGGQRMVLEMHEDVVTDLRSLGRLREQLRVLDIGLAYDDFGAGQARFTELAEVPPDFIKLDMKLIRDLDQSPTRQGLIEALNAFGRDLGIQLVAEGIETEEEAATCRRLGCHFGQGFLFGRPQPASALTPRDRRDTSRIDLRQVQARLRALS